MASGQESAGTTLMDLITSNPSASAANSSSIAAPSTLGKPATTEKKSKRTALMQMQSDTISAAKALKPVRTNPHKQKKKATSFHQSLSFSFLDLYLPVSYAELVWSIHELAATSDQKSSQRQLMHHVFPKLAVYNSVDPSVAPSLLVLHQQCEDRSVQCYVYYYLARVLSDSAAQGLSPGGGIPTPNQDVLADIDAVGGVTRADVIHRIVEQLTAEASNAGTKVEFQWIIILPFHGESKVAEAVANKHLEQYNLQCLLR